MDDVLKTLQEIDPLWSVVLVAAALAVLLVTKFWSASFARFVAASAAVLAICGVAAAGYYGFQHLEDTRRLAERRALDERAKLLFDQTVQPDSVFACIDGSPVPAIVEACEKSLFAEPRRVAAAVAIVTQRLAFLADALAFIERWGPDYARRVEPLRKSMESDPYGFVAFVLSVEHGCATESCAGLSLFRAPERVKENLRVRRLEAFLARYSAVWRDAPAPGEPAAAPAGRTIAPLVTISGETPPKPAVADKPAAAEPTPAQAAALPTESPAPETPAAPAATVTVSEPPAAALAPTVTPPAEGEGFATPQQTAAPADAAPAAPAAASTAAKSAARPQAQAKAKAKAADPVTRRTNEPVAGLPRVVPRDYIREKEEEKEDPKAQASGQQPGDPMPLIAPAQNLTGR